MIVKTETLKELKKEIPYKWRKGHGNSDLAYINARDAMTLLDEVVGPENWQCDYKQIKDVVYCGVSIKIDGEWVIKWDAGDESNIEAEKGEASDSFKRACVKWGIGRFLYDIKGKKSDYQQTAQAPSPESRTKAQCRSCDSAIYWGKTAAGKPCPYDWGTETSHFTTCPNAAQHSSKQHQKKAETPNEKMATPDQIKMVQAVLKNRMKIAPDDLMSTADTYADIDFNKKFVELTHEEAEKVIAGIVKTAELNDADSQKADTSTLSKRMADAKLGAKWAGKILNKEVNSFSELTPDEIQTLETELANVTAKKAA